MADNGVRITKDDGGGVVRWCGVLTMVVVVVSGAVCDPSQAGLVTTPLYWPAGATSRAWPPPSSV